MLGKITDDLVHLGCRIRELRLKKGLSQDEVAQPSYTAAYLSHLEHGKRRPSQAALTHIAQKFGMTYEQLLFGRDPDEDLRLEISVQSAMADVRAGETDRAIDSLRPVIGRARKTGNRRVEDMAETALGSALLRSGKPLEAEVTYDRVLERMADLSPEVRTTAVVGKSKCMFNDGDIKGAVHLLEGHLAQLDRLPEPDPGCLVETYAALIPGYFETGLKERAADVATRGWKLAPNIPDPDQRACLYVNRANVLVDQGQPREALTSLSLAEELYRHLGWHAEAVKVSLARSDVLTQQQRYAEAERLIRDALEAEATISRVDEIRGLVRLSMIRRLSGDSAAGLELAERAIKRAGAGYKGSAAEARRELGECALALGEEDRAVTEWHKALDTFIKLEDNEEVAKTAQTLGRHLAAAGDVDGALAVMDKGLTSAARLS